MTASSRNASRARRGGAPKHKGISYLLVPMRQDGIDIRPIHQITGEIYAGTNQIQRNIIGERALGLPKEPS